MSEIIPLLDRQPSSDREVYLPSRGGGRGPAKAEKPVPSKEQIDYYNDLKAQQRGRNAPPPEGGYEPGPYGDPRGAGEATFGPREAPTGMYNTPRYHGMGGEHFSIRQGPDGYYCLLHNPEASPVGPFPTAEAAADYFAPRGNQ